MKKTVLGAMVVAMAAVAGNANATSGYDKKFYISSDDGAYTLSPGLMVNGVWSRSDTSGTIADKMEMKKARLWFKGNWTDAFSYEFTYELNTSTLIPYQKYANITHNLGAVKLRFGLQKVYIGGDHSESSTMYQFVDRSGANAVGTAVMSRGGDPAGGLAILGSAGAVNYTLGVWDNPDGVGAEANSYDLSVAVDYTALGKMTNGMSDLTGERAVTVGAGYYVNNTLTDLNWNYTAVWLKYKGGGWSFGTDVDMSTKDATSAQGIMARVGKVFSENQEVAFRYDLYDADTSNSDKTTTMALAYNYFFNGENAKIMAEYDMASAEASSVTTDTNTMYVKYHVSF